MTPVFEATTTILIDPRSSGEMLFLDSIQGISRNQVQNYIEILRSRSIALRAVEVMGEHYEISSSEFNSFRNSISIQPVSGAEVVRVSVQNIDPAKASLAANSVAESFIEFSRELNREQASSARLFIEEQLDFIETDLRLAEEALQAYREEERILLPSEEAKIILGRLTDLETKYAEIDLEFQETQHRLQEVRRQLHNEYGPILTSSAISAHPSVDAYREQLTQLENRLADYSDSQEEYQSEVGSIQRQISEIEIQLAREIERIIASETVSTDWVSQRYLKEIADLETRSLLYRTRMDARRVQIDIIEERLTKLPEKEIKLARLVRDQNVTEQVYLLLRNKYEEMRIQEAMKTANVSILDASIIPDTPIKPRVRLNVAIAGFLGLFLGVGIAFFLEFLDTTLKNTEEIESVLGLPVMGRIPYTDNND